MSAYPGWQSRLTERGLTCYLWRMGKRSKKQKPADAVRTAERRRHYTFSHLVLANVIGWAVFLFVPFIVGKSFVGHGADIYPFFSLLGLGFTAGTILDYTLDNT